MTNIRACFIALAILPLLGCASTMDRSIALTEQTVTPITSGDQQSVSAYDLAEAMLQAGFTPEQILKDGPQIRNALATSGGAQVRYNHLAEAMFAVHGQVLYVTSRTRGTFTQPLRLVLPRG
jgi:hypothetical protein